MDALGGGAEGVEGAHYIMFSVLLLSLKKNKKNGIDQSGRFLANANQHPQKTQSRHIPAPRGSAPRPGL